LVKAGSLATPGALYLETQLTGTQSCSGRLLKEMGIHEKLGTAPSKPWLPIADDLKPGFIKANYSQ